MAMSLSRCLPPRQPPAHLPSAQRLGADYLPLLIVLPGLPHPHFTWAYPCTTHRLSLFDKNLQVSLYGTIAKMSDSPKREASPKPAGSPKRAASPERELSPKRAPIKINANGVISETQDEVWPGHPANSPYKGSNDSQNNRTDVNDPDR